MITKFVSRLKRLRWRWRLLIIGLVVLLVIFVIVPAAIYISRDREPTDYSTLPTIAETSYLVSYNSGDGLVNQSEHVIKVLETGVEKNSAICFHTATIYQPYPERKVNAIIVGSTKVTLAESESWRCYDDLRVVYKTVMQTNLPIINTAYTKITYSGYEGYPGWPYHLGDSWTYEESYDTDTPMQPGWTSKYLAEVVADDAIVMIGDTEYQCFQVVNTLIETTNRTSPGAGVGSTITEYWYKDAKSICPLKVEDYSSYRGTEIQIVTNVVPLPEL